MRKIGFWGGIVLWLMAITMTWAIEGAGGYRIDKFLAEIEINQDTSLTVKETIETTFLEPKHGIFRIIPYIYSAKGKTIKTDLMIEKVTDMVGHPIQYTVENFNQSKKIRIGDPNKTIIGKQNYVINYKVNKVIQEYGDGPELYWNVTGNEWDTFITKTEAVVNSNLAEVLKVECFGCISSFTKNKATFSGINQMSIVVGLDKNNQLLIPSQLTKLSWWLTDNWGYGVAMLPCGLMILAWYKKGRDKKYLTENVFYQPSDKTTKTVSLLNRPHLPLVYSPIDNLTPSEVGTIVDEKVDTKDIVAEIVELARLGYYKIEKIESKVLWMTNRDYKLIKIEKSPEKLRKYQQYLLEKLFEGKEEVKISDLKDHFYTHLAELKTKIYEELVKKKIFDEEPQKTISKWLILAVLMNVGGYFLTVFFVATTGNPGPHGLFFGLLIPSLLIVRAMPRKTAWGYSLHRQTKGLEYYLGKGKWREEIAEKRLFLEEMLPLAISLGVVNQLAADMRELEIEPPKYFRGVALNNFGSDLSHFNSAMATGLISSPTKYSGSGSWSGGSGFSGGGGGGGFGGGGGGSW